MTNEAWVRLEQQLIAKLWGFPKMTDVKSVVSEIIPIIESHNSQLLTALKQARGTIIKYTRSDCDCGDVRCAPCNVKESLTAIDAVLGEVGDASTRKDEEAVVPVIDVGNATCGVAGCSATSPAQPCEVSVIWEYFRDQSYYDQWAVREKGETRWGHCFHVPSLEEVKGLAEVLNARATEPVMVDPVSLEVGAKRIEHILDISYAEPQTDFNSTELSKACAEAWGLKYVD